MNAAIGATYSRYPLPHTQEPDYAAILRTLGYQTRGIFERLRDLFNGRAYIQLSLDLIASRIGCSRGLLVSVLQELEEIGLLKVYRQRIGPRRNEVNRYVLPEALIHPSFTVQPMNPAPRLAVHQEGRQPSAEVHVMNFPRAHESVRQEDGFLPSAASTESESERRKEEAVEDISSSATALQDSFSESEKARKTKVLTEAGIHPRNHKKLLAYPLADLQRAIELAREHADESFDGYVVTVLRHGFFDDETKVPPPQVEKIPPVAPYVEPAESVKPFQQVETATPEPTQPPVPHHPQSQPVSEAPPLRVVARHEVQQPQADPQAHSAPQPVQNPDDPDGQKAALFHSVGLKPHHYADCIVYSLYAIHNAIETARNRQAKHVGHYALAILRKQPSLFHNPQPQPQPQPQPTLATHPIDYSQFVNRWDLWEEQKAQQPPHDPNHDIWMSFSKNALASMGQKHHWLTIQHAYAGFHVETNELLLRRDKLPNCDAFVRQFVERLEIIPWNYQEADPTKRFCIKVKLI